MTNIVIKKKMIHYNKFELVEMKSRLKELRVRDGLNQSKLVKRAKISRQTVSLIEREEYMPSLLIAVRIAKVFQESIENIFIFEEEEL